MVGLNLGLDLDRPIVLDGDHVRMESMTLAHLPGLVACGLDPRIWTWMPFAVTDEAGMRDVWSRPPWRAAMPAPSSRS